MGQPRVSARVLIVLCPPLGSSGSGMHLRKKQKRDSTTTGFRNYSDSLILGWPGEPRTRLWKERSK